MQVLIQNHLLNSANHHTTHHVIHLPLFPTLFCILFLPFKQCLHLHLLTLLPPTQTFSLHSQVLSFQVTTKLQNTSVTITLLLLPQLASFKLFSSVLTFSFIFSIFFTELRRTGWVVRSVSGERGVWRSSWRAPRPICFSSCFSASFSLLSALMLSALYMWYVFITCRVEWGRARLALWCLNTNGKMYWIRMNIKL